MKIIMVDSAIGNDYSICLCNALSELGADTTLVVPENKTFSIPYKFRVHKWAPSKDRKKSKVFKIFTYLNYLKKLYSLTKSGSETIVHYQFFRRRDEIFFFLFLRLTGVNLVHTAHNVVPHNAKWYDNILQKLVYCSSGRIIAHSNFIKDKIIADFNINPEKIKVIPHGNFDIYLPEKVISREDARLKLKLKHTDNVVLFFGGIRDYKGLDTLLDAFRILKDENNLKLIIAGAPESKNSAEEYERKIRQITTNGKIIYNFNFIPNDEVAPYFIASDVIALPYKNIYHSGLVHLAYSFGKPIIATRVGDFEEAIEHEKTGLLLDKNTAEDLAVAIRRFFSIENRQDIETKVLKLNRTKYSWKTIAGQTLKLFDELC